MELRTGGDYDDKSEVRCGSGDVRFGGYVAGAKAGPSGCMIDFLINWYTDPVPAEGNHLNIANASNSASYTDSSVNELGPSDQVGGTYMSSEKTVCELLRQECILVDESPVDCPFVQKLPGEVVRGREIRPGQLRCRPRQEWNRQGELSVIISVPRTLEL